MPDTRKIMDNHRTQELIDDIKERLATKVDKTDTPYKPGGSIPFANLPALIAENTGYVYNISDSFETTSDFIDGEGIKCDPGTDVAIVSVPPVAPATEPTYMYNLFGGSSVMESITQQELEEMWKDAGVITLDNNTVSVAVGSTETVEITKATGAVTVESGDTDVATASVSGTTISIEGVATGNVDVTVTSASSATNRETTATITVTVS